MELLGLPQGSSIVGKQLLLALYSMAEERDRDEDVLALINAMALIFVSLPVSHTVLQVLDCTFSQNAGVLSECFV